MIELKISDPHLLDTDVLRKTAEYLLQLAGQNNVTHHIFNEVNESEVMKVTPEMPVVAEVPTIPEFETELDSDGQAWDEKLHSPNKKKTKDGKWRLAKNSKIPTIGPLQETPGNKPDFQKLMEKIAEGMKDGKLKLVHIQEIVARHGVATLPLLSTRLDLINLVYDEVCELIKNYEVE